jgi:hypothetical protein
MDGWRDIQVSRRTHRSQKSSMSQIPCDFVSRHEENMSKVEWTTYRILKLGWLIRTIDREVEFAQEL